MATNLRRAQAYSVVGRAVECGEKSLDERCHSQTAESMTGRLRRTNYGGHSRRPSTVRLPLLIAFLTIDTPSPPL